MGGSGFISSAQRLPNGNTLITEGADGRIFEVTSEHEIVWEYISPYYGKGRNHNMVYRAYRLPYDWVPHAEARGEAHPPARQQQVPGHRLRGEGDVDHYDPARRPGQPRALRDAAA